MLLRQPTTPGHPPRLAVHLERTIDRRADLPGVPTQVYDRFAMDDNDRPRRLDRASLVETQEDAVARPLPQTLRYRFPYARSRRSQIVWRSGIVRVHPGPL
jgi:hypothetical protein